MICIILLEFSWCKLVGIANYFHYYKVLILPLLIFLLDFRMLIVLKMFSQRMNILNIYFYRITNILTVFDYFKSNIIILVKKNRLLLKKFKVI